MTEKVAKKETLTPVRFDVTKAALAKMGKACAAFMDVPETAKDYKELTGQIALVRTTRTAIDKRRKEANAPVLKWQRELKARADLLINQLANMEAPLLHLKAEADDLKAEAKEAEQLAEQERIERIETWIDAIRREALAAMQPGVTVANVKQSIEDVTEHEISEDAYQEYTARAEAVKQETLRTLKRQLDLLEEQEEQDRVRKEETEQLEKLRKEQAEEKARLDKQKADQDAVAKKLQDEEDERKRIIQEEKDAEIAEAARIKAEDERVIQERKDKKAEAAGKRKKAAYRKKLLDELDTVEEYVNSLDVTPPKVSCTEAGGIIGCIELMLNEARADIKAYRDE